MSPTSRDSATALCSAMISAALADSHAILETVELYDSFCKTGSPHLFGSSRVWWEKDTRSVVRRVPGSKTRAKAATNFLESAVGVCMQYE